MLLLSVLSYGGGHAQPTFEAYADAKEIVQNSYFEITFTLRGDQGSDFQPPDFADFIVLSGPSRSFRTSVINGQVSQEVSYTYQLQPKRTGTLRIGEAQIKAGGNILRTKPLSIRVVQGQADTQAGEEVLLQARISSREAYLGQQLVLDYVLSSRVEYRGLTAVAEPDYSGFYSRPVQQFDTRIQREVIDGIQYSSRIVKRVVLYPQETGTLTIDPLTVVLGIVIPGRTGGGFFSSIPTRRVTLSTAAIEVEVRPLPLPQPANFSGITGNYQMRVQATKTELSTDDAVSVYLLLEGRGDLNRVQAPNLNFPEQFERYDPKVKEEEYYDLPNEVKGRKVFEYLLVPKQAGQFRFEPELVIFNPDSAAYVTLRAAALHFTVSPGSGAKDSGLVADGQKHQELYGPRATIELRKQQSRFFGTPLFWGVYALPFVAGVWLWLSHWRQQQQPAVDPALL
ncbi:MAG: protein BatD, partial [Bacteroidetes bacterium]